MANRVPVLVLVAVAMILLALGEQQDKQIEQQQYCEMVRLWHENKQLPPEQRPGWPPYKGEEMCHDH